MDFLFMGYNSGYSFEVMPILNLLLSNDVSIYTVSKLLGHSSVHITEIYRHMIDEKKDEAVNKIPRL